MINAIKKRLEERRARRLEQAAYLEAVEGLAHVLRAAMQPGRRHAVGYIMRADRIAGRIAREYDMPAAAVKAHARDLI